MAVTEQSTDKLQRGQLGLFGVIMPGLAQVAPAFNLFFTTGVMVALAGASAPLIFLISMVGMGATASSLAQFAGVYPSAGSFITYITRSIGTKVAVAVGVITVLGYIIAFGGIYIFVGSYIVQNVLGNPHIWGITQIVTILYGALVVAPVIVGPEVRRPGDRRPVRVRGRAAARAQPHHPGPGRAQRPVLDPVHLAGRLQGRAAGVQPGRAGVRRVRGGRPAGRGDPQPPAQRAARGPRRGRGQRDHLRDRLVRAGDRVRRRSRRRRWPPTPTRSTPRPRRSPVRGAAHHLGLPVQRDEFLRGGQHPDLPGDLRRRPRRAVDPRAGRGQPPVPHARRGRDRLRGAEHPDRRRLHRVHRSRRRPPGSSARSASSG